MSRELKPTNEQLEQYNAGVEYFRNKSEPTNHDYIYSQSEYWQLGYNESLHQHLYELGCARKESNLYERLPYMKDN